MIRSILYAWHVFAYYFSWVLFMGFGFFLSVASLPLLPWRARPGLQKKMRALQRGLFRVWTWWFRASGVVRIHWSGFDAPLPPATVYISTHPSVVDAPLLITRLPDTICVAKPGIMSNPALGAAARVAGYVTGTEGVDMVRLVSEKIHAGQSLLVFPEGTRTEAGATMNPFKPGFALIASRANARIQLIVTRVTPGLGARGRPWWRLPDALPLNAHFSLERSWEVTPEKSLAALSAEIEAHALERVRAMRETP